jgi:hypothetical protein
VNQVLPYTIFAGVKGIAPEGATAGRRRHYHFSHGGAVHDGAQLALILVANHVENESFADMEADAKCRFCQRTRLPSTEARPVRLADFERLEIRAQHLLPQSLPSGGGTAPKSSTSPLSSGADQQPGAVCDGLFTKGCHSHVSQEAMAMGVRSPRSAVCRNCRLTSVECFIFR